MTNDIKNDILKQIREGKLHMHSSGYFALRIGALALVVILALIVSVLIFNYISFSIRFAGEDELLNFGPRGFLFFLQMFPWHLLALDVLLIVVAERMLRYFRFGYRNPVLVLLAGLLVLTVAFGLLVDRATPFNQMLARHAHRKHLGPFNEMFVHSRLPPLDGGICRCVVIAVGTSSVIAYHPGASTTPLTIYVPAGFMMRMMGIKAGDIVYVAGDREGDTIRAFGMRVRMSERR